MSTSELYIGLMSGTSLDGVDAALICFDGEKSRLVDALYHPFEQELRAELLALNRSGNDEIQRAALAGNTLAQRYSCAVSDLLAKTGTAKGSILAIGCHGQTVRHRPDLGFTCQIGNASLVAELTGITVVADFRSRDIAAGGQGAPLVPAFHASAFRHAVRHRVIANIGGISNLTWLPAAGPVSGFDCGPGNLLLDAWAQLHLGTPFDRDGEWAASGTVIADLLENLLDHPFFACPPPKSTGRDMFNLEWLQPFLAGHHAPADTQATLLEFSARTLADAILLHFPSADEVYLCGGGAHNSTLRRRFTELLPSLTIALTDELGIGADWVEAAAFAWLARRTRLLGPGNLPEVTGATGPRILGAVYPA